MCSAQTCVCVCQQVSKKKAHTHWGRAEGGSPQGAEDFGIFEFDSEYARGVFLSDWTASREGGATSKANYSGAKDGGSSSSAKVAQVKSPGAVSNTGKAAAETNTLKSLQLKLAPGNPATSPSPQHRPHQRQHQEQKMQKLAYEHELHPLQATEERTLGGASDAIRKICDELGGGDTRKRKLNMDWTTQKDARLRKLVQVALLLLLLCLTTLFEFSSLVFDILRTLTTQEHTQENSAGRSQTTSGTAVRWRGEGGGRKQTKQHCWGGWRCGRVSGKWDWG